MCYFSIFLYILLIKLLMSHSISSHQNPLTIIGNKNVTRRSNINTPSFSKLSIYGPFYCYITWINDKQTMDIYTDDNIHPYVIITTEKKTLKIVIQSDANFKFTQMDIHLKLHPTITEIFLGGISTIHSANVLKMNNLLRIHTEGMKIHKKSTLES